MLYKPTVTRKRPDGTKYREKSRNWWGRYRNPRTGLRVSVALRTADRSAAKLLLADIERRAIKEAAGLPSFDDHLNRPLVHHIDDWAKALAGKGNTPYHVEVVTGRARKVVEGCKFRKWRDISASDLDRYIGQLRDSGPTAESKTGLRARPRNHYRRAIHQFSRWMKDDRRAPDDPLGRMKAEPVTDEQEAGIFDPDELRRLLNKTESGPVRCGTA